MRLIVNLMQESSEKWRAWVPELPGCAARGQSPGDVRKRIDQAIRGYLASLDLPDPDDIEEDVVQVSSEPDRGFK